MKRGHLLITLLVATGLFFATFLTVGCGGGGGSYDPGPSTTCTPCGATPTSTLTATPSTANVLGKTLNKIAEELASMFVLIQKEDGTKIGSMTSGTYGDYSFNVQVQKVIVSMFDKEGGTLLARRYINLVPGHNWINLQEGYIEYPTGVITPTPTNTPVGGTPTPTTTATPTGGTPTPTNTPGSGTGNISGKTFDLNPLPNPAPGANIKLTKGSEEVTKTSGSDGSYSFIGLAAGTWHMKASYNGKNIEKDITVTAGYETIMNLYFGAVQGSALKTNIQIKIP